MPVVQGNVKTVHAIKRHREKSIQVCLHTKCALKHLVGVQSEISHVGNCSVGDYEKYYSPIAISKNGCMLKPDTA